MSDHFKPKMSISDEIFSSFALRNKNQKTNLVDSDPGTSYEVFRNNTTAVEVIVKEVPKSKQKTAPSIGKSAEYHDVATIKRLQDDIDRLRTDLNIANNALTRSRKGFLAMTREMKKQLDAAHQRESETQAKSLALQLENEKLKSLLGSNSNLLNKFKKELTSMKRVMRYVIKSICTAATQQVVVSETVTCSSDPEYDDFENDLKKNVKVKFACNMFDTFDSSVSKDTKYSFDKRMF